MAEVIKTMESARKNIITPVREFTGEGKKWLTQTMHFKIDDIDVCVELDISKVQEMIPVKLIIDSPNRKFRLET
jgi:hypothetical protein